jgi:hypothetical protein
MAMVNFLQILKKEIRNFTFLIGSQISLIYIFFRSGSTHSLATLSAHLVPTEAGGEGEEDQSEETRFDLDHLIFNFTLNDYSCS